MTIQHLKITLMALIGLLAASCSKDTQTTPDDTWADIRLQVSATTTWESDGEGNPQREYMQIRENDTRPWQRLAMGGIEDFDYVHGHAYELEVRKTTTPSAITYRLLRILSDTPQTTPDALPEEAKFQLKMVQHHPFMDLDTPLPAPFDGLDFRIVNRHGGFFSQEYLHYYDSIVLSSPVMPDTYCIYNHKSYDNGSETNYTRQWASHFFEKSDFKISLKGYKDNKVRHESTITQLMRERDFLGVDWTSGSVALANPRTSVIYCLLDTRHEFLLTDTRETNKTRYISIKVKYDVTRSDAENLKRQLKELQWLMERYPGQNTHLSSSEFKTVPHDVEFIQTAENKTTRVALLHHRGDDLHEECYSLIAESKL